MSAPVPGKIDRGIEFAVRLLQAYGVETYESCEGGKGHAYLEPAVRFHGSQAAGWRALQVCLDYGLPIYELRRSWYVAGNEPIGPTWEITFREKITRKWDKSVATFAHFANANPPGKP